MDPINPSPPPAETPPIASPPTPPSPPVISSIPVEKSHKKLFTMIAIVATAGLLGTGLFVLAAKNDDPAVKGVQEETAPQTTPSPSPTPMAAIDRSEWTLEVLNGSGVTGAAAKTAEKLTNLGYEVVKTGNADNQEYETSQLYITKEMQANVDILLKDLKGIVNISTFSGELKNSTASARLIIGKE